MSVSVASQTTKDGVTDAYRHLSANGRRTFWACCGGFAMDAMDFMIFPLVIGTLISLWKMDPATAGGIASVTLWSSAVGGWLAGYLADRIGRVRTMQLTILMFSLGSLLSAFAQDQFQLTLARGLLGIGFGGEAAVASVALSEVVAAQYRGRVMGAYAASFAVGQAAAVLLQAIIFSFLAPEIAWRVLFAVGALPAILILFIRRNVEESDISTSMRASESRPSLLSVFSSDTILATIKGTLITTGTQGGNFSLIVWIPQFLRSEHKISIIGSTHYLLTVFGGAFCGYLVGGWLADRFGRRFVLIASSVCAAALAFIYTHIDLPGNFLLFLGFPLGFFALAPYSAVLPLLNELYPTRVRGTGVGFTYNAGRAVGGLFPFLVGVMASQMPLGSAINLFAVLSYGLLFVAALALNETKGVELSS